MTIELEETAPLPATEDAPAPAPKADDLETIAREVGWKPETEWKGEPPEGGFLSPAEFIRHQKAKRDVLAKEISALRRDTEKRIKRMEEKTAKQREKEIAALHDEYNFLIRQAIRDGDDEREEALRAQMDDKLKEAEAVGEEEEAEELTEDKWVEQFQPSYPEIQKRFYADGHAWILDDDADPDAMRVMLDFIDAPNTPFAEALEKADRALRKAYPDRYEDDMDEQEDEKPARKRVPVLAPGGRGAGGGVSAASRLTPAQRQIGQRFVDQKLFANLEEYAEQRLKMDT